MDEISNDPRISGAYFNEVYRRKKNLRCEEHRELALLVEDGDPDAREALITSCLPLVINIARRFCGRRVDISDLVQDGNMGLIRAVEGFEPEMGVNFTTYASYWITQSISRRMANGNRVVYVPQYAVDMFRDWGRAALEAEQRLGRPPRLEDVKRQAKMTDAETEIVSSAKAAIASSLDVTPFGLESSSDSIVPDSSRSSEEEVDLLDEFEHLISRRWPLLTYREALVIELRFELNECSKTTLSEVARMLGITRERVRQIEAKAIEKLGGPVVNKGKIQESTRRRQRRQQRRSRSEVA